MSSSGPSPKPWVRRTALAIILAVGIFLVAPSSAAPPQEPEARLETLASRTFTGVWSAWLELWSPVASWLSTETSAGETDTSEPTGGDGGGTDTGGSGGLDPGGGGGYVDPSG